MLSCPLSSADPTTPLRREPPSATFGARQTWRPRIAATVSGSIRRREQDGLFRHSAGVGRLVHNLALDDHQPGLG